MDASNFINIVVGLLIAVLAYNTSGALKELTSLREAVTALRLELQQTRTELSTEREANASLRKSHAHINEHLIKLGILEPRPNPAA